MKMKNGPISVLVLLLLVVSCQADLPDTLKCVQANERSFSHIVGELKPMVVRDRWALGFGRLEGRRYRAELSYRNHN